MSPISLLISKFPFFKYDFQSIGVAPGYHFFQKDGEILRQSNKINILCQPGVLLHFKFVKPNLRDFFQESVQQDQDLNGVSDGNRRAISSWSAENKSYELFLSQNGGVNFFDQKYSKILNEINDLACFFRET